MNNIEKKIEILGRLEWKCKNLDRKEEFYKIKNNVFKDAIRKIASGDIEANTNIIIFTNKSCIKKYLNHKIRNNKKELYYDLISIRLGQKRITCPVPLVKKELQQEISRINCKFADLQVYKNERKIIIFEQEHKSLLTKKKMKKYIEENSVEKLSSFSKEELEENKIFIVKNAIKYSSISIIKFISSIVAIPAMEVLPYIVKKSSGKSEMTFLLLKRISKYIPFDNMYFDDENLNNALASILDNMEYPSRNFIERIGEIFPYEKYKNEFLCIITKVIYCSPLMEELIKLGANPNFVLNGETPLTNTIINSTGHLEKLIDAGASINGVKGSKLTPIQACCYSGETCHAETLLEMGALYNRTDLASDWNEPIEIAIAKGNVELLKMLCKKGAKVTEWTFHTVVRMSDEGMIDKISPIIIETLIDLDLLKIN